MLFLDPMPSSGVNELIHHLGTLVPSHLHTFVRGGNYEGRKLQGTMMFYYSVEKFVTMNRIHNVQGQLLDDRNVELLRMSGLWTI